MIYHMLVICWNVIFRFLPDFAGFSDVKSGKKFLFVLLATRRIFPENFSTIWQLILWKLQLSGFFRIFSEKPDHRSGFFGPKITPYQRRSQQKKVQPNRSRRSWVRAQTILWLLMIIIKASKATLVHYMNEGWLTNWGIKKFFPWRPLKIE